jgi:hypothetical protein
MKLLRGLTAILTAVLNASPVIILARAGFLELVPKLVSSPVIPRAVADISR